MFKKWFDFATKDSGFNNSGASSSGSPAPEPVKPGLGLPELDEEGEHAASTSSPSESAGAPATTGGFERVYRNAAVKPLRIPYGILKVMSMADSTHLAGMHPEVKRCALLMALEAAGAEIEDLLQDAVIRQRILHDFEEKAQERLREFEAANTVDSQAIQAELDRITVQYMVRIQANADLVARQQDKVRAWQQRKQRECQRMTEAAAFLVPQEGANHRTLTAVLERATFSGIGISCGSGLCNVCMAVLSVPVISFSVPKAGDFIDTQAAIVTGDLAIRMRVQKERAFHLNGLTGDRVHDALNVYYQEVLVNLVQTLRSHISSAQRLPNFEHSIPLVLSGGTTMPKGFLDHFMKALRSSEFPVKLSEVRISADPLNSTARGALMAALC